MLVRYFFDMLFRILIFYYILISSIYSECILSSFYDFNTKQWLDNFSCPEEVLKTKQSSGSLFKIFLVMSGYHYKILDKKDIHTIQEKMLVSDNEYFVDLIKKINKNRFILFSNQYLKNYLYPISENNFPNDFSYLYGGNLKFFPKEILDWFKKLSLDEREFSRFALETIKRNEIGITYYGKSGTWGGSAWFCGIIKTNSINVLCVLNRYIIPNWKDAKNKSYETFKKIMMAGN